MKFPVRRLAPFALLLLIVFSCKKESFSDNPSLRLQTSADSLHFDTVFTSTGSVTQFIKVINTNDEGLRVNSIRLAGGAASPFRINVDGFAGPQVQNLDIAANDSLYIYVTVTIDPTAGALAFIVEDSIEISYNGNVKKIQLDAYGQNAHFFRNRNITATEAWENDLPYVILDGLTVAPGATLTIGEGCRIYMHANAPLIIQGTLNVEGDHWDSTRVVFAGDRLDIPYRDFPAGWPGILFTETSRDNSIRYGIIKNAYQGIVVTDPAPGTKLKLYESIIDNAYDIGLLAVNSSVEARNVLISNCGRNLALVKGGQYSFTHCTVASFSNLFIQHKEPVLLLTNYLSQNNVVTTADLQAIFRNCIFWGDNSGFVDNEIVLGKEGSSAYNVLFDGLLWRGAAALPLATVQGEIRNENPQFDTINVSERRFSFRLKDGSPALDKGAPASVFTDLDGALRPVGLPDLGAYEKQ